MPVRIKPRPAFLHQGYLPQNTFLVTRAFTFVFLFLFLFSSAKACLSDTSAVCTEQSTGCSLAAEVIGNNPGPLKELIQKKLSNNRRAIAACLAFPLPVGFLGAHRIFLGTKPYIPVAYAGTLGGCLGAIPMIDFFVILFSKNFEQYLNNPKLFMWVK
jgi:energy-converting hydrogenase Eha subunit A